MISKEKKHPSTFTIIAFLENSIGMKTMQRIVLVHVKECFWLLLYTYPVRYKEITQLTGKFLVE
jgi:hypothetical protein